MEPPYLEPGTPLFRAVALALLALGLATFAVLYCVQPLMPLFAATFHLSPAASSLALSATTGLLAPMLLVAGSISDALGRKRVMVASILASSVLTFFLAAAPSWGTLLLLRALQGITLSGLQAVGMAYLGEEVAPSGVGAAMGLFVAGSGLGGMAGRILAGVTADLGGWRAALVGVGLVSLCAGLIVGYALPPSRHFAPRPLTLRGSLGSLAGHLGDGVLCRLYVLALLLMGGFVAIYNYIAFRLLAPPYALSQAVVGAIFVVYLVGVAGSTWMGRLADRHGRRPVITAALLAGVAGLVLTLARPLLLVVLGLALFTFGFFGAHSAASGWVSRRARTAKAQASSLYLFSFYLGSTAVAPAVGLLWPVQAWPGVAAAVAVLLLGALVLARTLPEDQPAALPRTGSRMI
jgi:MFS transporter, YNFM family, putative membrane transport protein